MDDNKLVALTSLDLKFNDVKDFKYIFPWVNTDLTLKKDHRVISYSLDARDMNNLNKFVKDFMISFNGDFYLLFDQIHNTNYKNKWEVVLKYWLQIFLTNFFIIIYLLKNFPFKYNTSNIKINLFNKNKFNIFFKNTWEFSYFVQKHEYNHILLSKLLNIFSIVDKNSPSYNFSISNPFKYSIRKKIKDFLNFLLLK